MAVASTACSCGKEYSMAICIEIGLTYVHLPEWLGDAIKWVRISRKGASMCKWRRSWLGCMGFVAQRCSKRVKYDYDSKRQICIRSGAPQVEASFEWRNDRGIIAAFMSPMNTQLSTDKFVCGIDYWLRNGTCR